MSIVLHVTASDIVIKLLVKVSNIDNKLYSTVLKSSKKKRRKNVASPLASKTLILCCPFYILFTRLYDRYTEPRN